jgi:stage 0 sporulation protein B (sporulation initiation phosphotransferase)
MEMQQWQRIRFISTIVLFVSLLMLIWISSSFLQAVGLAMLGLIGCAGILLSIRNESKQLEAANQRQLIELISHYRHDWMNDIQLLFGYVTLKKYDKLDDCMDKIRSKALQESSTAKLGIPSLVAFFISFRLYYNALALELEMEDEINLASLSIDKEKVSHLVQMTVKLFHSHAAPAFEEPNILSVQFDLEGDALLFDLIYKGGYEEQALKRDIQMMMSSFTAQFATIEEEYTANKAVLTIRLPFLH